MSGKVIGGALVFLAVGITQDKQKHIFLFRKPLSSVYGNQTRYRRNDDEEETRGDELER